MKKIKINNNIIFLFLFYTLFDQIFSNYIILPFNTKKTNSSSFTSKTNYYTLLSLGQPQKTIEMYILLRQYNFYLGKGLCRLSSFSDYLPYESGTFKNYSDYIYQMGDIKNATNATDNYFFYINDLNLKKNITVKDMQFYYGVNAYINETIDNETICGIIGFNIYYVNQKHKENYFINILKKNNITSSYAFSFIFYNDYTKNTIFGKNNKNTNFLIIGMNEAEISKTYNTDDLRTIKTNADYNTYGWFISIDEIFLNNNNSTDSNANKKLVNSDMIVNFDNEFDFIVIRTEDFDFIRNYFFKNYIEKNICKFTLDSSDFYYISCDLSFKTEINKFPDINFMIRDINYTFTLTYEDLFIELNQKIYFMIVNEYYHFIHWSLGNIFLKKFPLVFDYDRKAVTFININKVINNEKKSNFYLLLFFIIGICIIVGIIFGIIVGKILNKNKKKRANELADDYEYNTNERNNEQKLFENGNEINN